MDKEMFLFQKAALQGDVSEPLCAEYLNEWRQCGDNKEKLVKLALRQQSCPYIATYCYLGKGLQKEYIKDAFRDFINGYVASDCDNVKGYTYGLYVDHDTDINMNVDVAHLMWCNGLNVTIPTALCPTLYVSNKSKVNLICDGFNSVRIYLFDESEVLLEDVDSESTIIIYRYSNKASVNVGKFCLSTNIRLFDKKLRL